MVQQATAGGTGIDPHLLAVTSKKYGVGIADLFAPAQRVGYYGLHHLAAASASANNHGPTAEGMPMFGLLLTVLAVFGLAVSWRRRSAWQLAALWLGCAVARARRDPVHRQGPARAVAADLAWRPGIAG